MCIGIEYRQAAPVSLITFLFLATASFPSLSLSLSSSLLSPSSSTMSSATASSSSKSSASSYESCDLIDRIASLPLGISRLCSHCLAHSLFLFTSLLKIFSDSCLVLSSVRRVAMRCNKRGRSIPRFGLRFNYERRGNEKYGVFEKSTAL